MAYFTEMHGARVLVPEAIDEEFGFRPPPGILRMATGIEAEFGVVDPNVIRPIDIEFGNVPRMIANYNARQNQPPTGPA